MKILRDGSSHHTELLTLDRTKEFLDLRVALISDI